MRLMRLDILIPTFNRAPLLRNCLESVLRASSPDAVDWRVTVIDNNSSDDTKQVVESFAERSERVHYLFEPRQGKSAALNSAIGRSNCDVIGMIDDDEQIGEQWIEMIGRWFSDPAVDLIGGPYLALWSVNKPDWLPVGYGGVLSADNVADLPMEPVKYPDPRVFLRGGNVVLRRAVFEQVGQYREELGRTGEGLGSCEDHDMFLRMMEAGLTGYFVPDLVIYHTVPPERVTRRYHRRWAWGQARSLAIMDREHPQPCAYFGRIPRYMLGEAIRGIGAWLGGNQSRRFSAELKWWSVAGFAWEAYTGRSGMQPEPRQK